MAYSSNYSHYPTPISSLSGFASCFAKTLLLPNYQLNIFQCHAQERLERIISPRIIQDITASACRQRTDPPYSIR